jgi:hypothetical protein
MIDISELTGHHQLCECKTCTKAQRFLKIPIVGSTTWFLTRHLLHIFGPFLIPAVLLIMLLLVLIEVAVFLTFV